MDKAVQPIDARHQARKGHEELLDRNFPEDVQALLELDQLEGMSASDVDSAFDESHGRECAAELIDLMHVQISPGSLTRLWLAVDLPSISEPNTMPQPETETCAVSC